MKTLTSIIALIAIIATLAIAGSREIPTSTSRITQWTAIATNTTVTLTCSTQPIKIRRVFFHTAAAATGTNVVDLVMNLVTNRIASVTQAAVADAQWDPDEEYWMWPLDSIRIGANNISTSVCTIVVEYEHN